MTSVVAGFIPALFVGLAACTPAPTVASTKAAPVEAPNRVVTTVAPTPTPTPTPTPEAKPTLANTGDGTHCLRSKIAGYAAGPDGKAEEPFGMCSASITMHEPDPTQPGERGGLSGFDFSTAATQKERDRAKDICCYGNGTGGTASTPGHQRDGVTCMSVADSQSAAKPHTNAAAPYGECAAGIFSHDSDPDRPGERGGLSSTSFSEENTASARSETQDMCCYGG